MAHFHGTTIGSHRHSDGSVVGLPLPGVPSAAMTTVLGGSTATIAWTAGSPVGTSYGLELESPSGAGNWAVPAGVMTGTSFAATGLSSATGYRPRVRAINGAGVSDWVVGSAFTMDNVGAGGGTVDANPFSPASRSYSAPPGSSVIRFGKGTPVTPTVAEFIGSPLSGFAPLAVTFTDQSTGGATSWAWDFGDGGTSASQNPTHVYAAAGSYTVSLTASGPGGVNTRTRSAYVTPTGATVSDGMSFAEIPEIVFVSGYAGQNEHMGIFHLDYANRWAPGDLTNTSGWAPSIATELVPQDGASLPAGLAYNGTTGILSYDGSEATAATRSVTVRLRVTGDVVESARFRIRILRPTVIWGTGATTDPNIAANFAEVPKYDPVDGGASGLRGATYLNVTGTATDEAPNVLLITPGSYTSFDDGVFPPGQSIASGRLYLAENRKYFYIIGAPNGKPVINGNSLQRNWAVGSNRLSYIKNFEFVDFGVSEGSYSNAEADLADRTTYVTQVIGRDSTTSTNWYGASAMEGSAAWAWIKSRVTTWFWGVHTVSCGGLDTTHMMYIEGRANSELQINNCKFLGGRRNNTVKSTRFLNKVRNTYLSTFRDPQNPAVGQRTAELIDIHGCGSTVIYNNHFLAGYTPALGGIQHGLLRKRLRRDWWGSDTPAYPDVSFSPPTTSNAGGGYSSPPGFGPGPDVYVSPAFWAAVNAKPISDPTNPYNFPYFVSFNTFEWYEEGAGRRPWFRDDGTYPVQATAQFATSEILGTAPAGWVERSANFFVNNTLIGWDATDAAVPTRFANLSDNQNISTNPSSVPVNPATYNTTLGIWVNGPGPYINPPPSRALHYNEGLVTPWDAGSAFVPVPDWFLAAERQRRLPEWATSVRVGQWATVPLSTSWSDVDPENDPAVNPNFPASAPWRGSNGLLAHINAWCGGATDNAGTWCNVIGAGHTNGGDNAAYQLNLRSEEPGFVRLSNPSGSLPGAIVINDGQEATGLHSDGRARAGHSYSSVHWDPLRQTWVWTSQRGSYLSGAGGGNFPVLVDPETGAHTCLTNLVSPVTAQPRYASAYDPRRDRTYVKFSGSNPIYALNLNGTDTASAWSTLGASMNVSGYTVLTYIPGLTAAEDMLLFWSTATGWQVMNIATATWYPVTMTGTPAWDAANIGYMQPAWEPVLRVLLCWNNATNTTQITRITPGDNPYADAWAIDTIPVSVSNAVTPSAANANGTYGRFFLWPNARLAVIVNGLGANDVFSFKYA